MFTVWFALRVTEAFCCQSLIFWKDPGRRIRNQLHIKHIFRSCLFWLWHVYILSREIARIFQIPWNGETTQRFVSVFNQIVQVYQNISTMCHNRINASSIGSFCISTLAHCGLIIELSQEAIAWRHQAITNVNKSPVRFCGMHPREILQEML